MSSVYKPIRMPEELVKKIEKDIGKKKFKHFSNAVVSIIKKHYKIK